MRKTLLMAALAITALVGFTSSASALRASPGGAITAASSGALVFSGPGGVTTSCLVSLTGSISAGPISVGSSAGTISGNRLASCTVTTAALTGTPWQLVYETDLLSGGVLSGVLGRLTGVGFSVAILGTTCLYTGAVPVLVAQAAGGSNTITVLANSLARSSGSSALCGTGSLRTGSTFTSTPAQTLAL